MKFRGWILILALLAGAQAFGPPVPAIIAGAAALAFVGGLVEYKLSGWHSRRRDAARAAAPPDPPWVQCESRREIANGVFVRCCYSGGHPCDALERHGAGDFSWGGP